MVGDIQAISSGGSYSATSLNFIQNEIKFANTDLNGNFTDDEQKGFTLEAANAVKSFGMNKNIFSQKVTKLIIENNKKLETSKEAAPDMDLNLEDDADIPSPPKV